MNACSAKVAYDIMRPNSMVMNTIIASGLSGLQVMITNQFSNIFVDEPKVSIT